MGNSVIRKISVNVNTSQALVAKHDSKWHIDHTTEKVNGEHCHIWDAAVTGSGYPKIHTASGTFGFHRLACEAENGPPPLGKWDASHLCHNRLCVNGKHLAWEPHRANMWRVFNRDEEPPEDYYPPLPIEEHGFYDAVTAFEGV